MHQRPPADPYNKDDLLVPADVTPVTTIVMATDQPEVVDDTIREDGENTGYHGLAANEADNDENTRHVEVDLFDDVFGGGDGDEQSSQPATFSPTTPSLTSTTATATTATDVHPSDMNRLQQEHSTAGYREGLTAGKNASLQAGFDEGYSLGAALGLVVGKLLGLLEGLVLSEDGDEDGRQGMPENGSSSSSSSSSLLARARQELAMTSVFSPTFFAPDGTWLYDVEEKEQKEEGEIVGKGEQETTIFDVARAHPLVQTWSHTVDGEVARYRMRWAKPGEETALAAVLGLTENDNDGDEPKKAGGKIGGGKATAPTSTATATAAASPGAEASPARAAPPNTSALDW